MTLWPYVFFYLIICLNGVKTTSTWLKEIVRYTKRALSFFFVYFIVHSSYRNFKYGFGCKGAVCRGEDTDDKLHPLTEKIKGQFIHNYAIILCATISCFFIVGTISHTVTYEGGEVEVSNPLASNKKDQGRSLR